MSFGYQMLGFGAGASAGGYPDILAKVNVWYAFESAANLGLDSHGALNLTNTAVTQTTGQVGSAGQFTATSSARLSATATSAVNVNQSDWSLMAWIYFDSKTSQRPIVGIWNISATSYLLYYDQVSDRLKLVVKSTGFPTATANTYGSPATGAWLWVYAQHDTASQKIGISVNNGTLDEVSQTGTITSSLTEFAIGRQTAQANYHDGRLDEVAVFGDMLTADERTTIYDNQLTYADL